MHFVLFSEDLARDCPGDAITISEMSGPIFSDAAGYLAAVLIEMREPEAVYRCNNYRTFTSLTMSCTCGVTSNQ